MSSTIAVPGKSVPDPDEQLASEYVDVADVGISIEVRAAVDEIEIGRRDGDEPQHLEGEDSDVVEIIDGDGVHDYFTVADLRGMATVRDADRGGVIDLSSALVSSELPLRGASAELRSARVLRRDFPAEVIEALDIIEKLKGAIVDKASEIAARNAARFLVSRIESPIADDDPDEAKRKRRPKRHGVYHIDSRMTMSPADRVDDVLPKTDDPYLCFIHGTASHTQNGFGGLLGTDEWRRLVERYGDRILALEHPTLSVSPAENALRLAEMLPVEATLHLVSHSRGGLVGDLVSLGAQAGRNGGLDIDRLARLRGEDAEAEIEALANLSDLLKAKTIDVARFARAGAPASGTLLASGRLDTWAKYLMNIVGLIPGLQGTPWGSILKTLVLTFLDQRSSTDVIPGLEAQQPESPFIHFINTAQTELQDGLGVVAHDVEGRGWTGRPAVWLADRFYGEDHDLVVDTRAMYQGVPRSENPNNAYVSFHKGAENNHFKYFSERDPRTRITDWLLNKDLSQPPAGFVKVDRSAKKLEEPPANRDLSATAPVVVVVPALMGSTLTDDGETIWPSAAALSRGLGAVSVSKSLAVGGVTDAYGDLSTHLAGRFGVELFGFDWRRSLKEAADQLQTTLGRLADTRPVHIVAHSTGCMVALLALADESLRERLLAADGRTLLLSPPLGGTMTALREVSARSHLARLLHLVDPARTPVQLAQQMQRYDSMLESLPLVGDHWDAAWWDDKGLGKSPDRVRLNTAREVGKAATLPADSTGVIVVVGSNSRTATAVSMGPSGLGFSGTMAGDGVVTHSALQDASAPVYYAEGGSRSLINTTRALTAYTDLLSTGHTTSLSQVAPEIPDKVVAIPDRSALFPSDGDLLDAALGAAGPPPTVDDRLPLHVEVVHADLEFAEHPVMIGQFEGSIMFGAMRALDKALGGLVGDRFKSGAFPGPLGTHVTILTRESGGVIVGMGEIADLTGPELARSVTEATIDYALRRYETSGGLSNGDDMIVSLSPLLIGTSGFSGLEIPSSIESILKGVIRANRVLRDREVKVRVGKVSFIELYEDVAVAATKATLDAEANLASNPDVVLVVNRYMRTGKNGVPGQPDPRYREGDWRRLAIEGVKDRSSPETSDAVGLLFTSVGKRARAERMVTASQRGLIDMAVAEAINRPGGDDQVQNTLYELLLPDGLKGEGTAGENLLLVLDGEIANYPWEMLSTRGTRPGDKRLTPLSVEVGFLRRLTTQSYKLRPKSAAGNHALVIGDPPAGTLPVLPAAREEAHQVADIFEASGYDVERIISGEVTGEITPLRILNGLFRADYRVIHIAAHGDYNNERPLRSGIIIGDGQFLTATEFGRLAVTPDLVFLNCCHLGRVSEGSSKLQAGAEGHFHQLAASLARQLIEDGVRAVVAAGWAVNDDDAAAFASRFYGELLGGSTLGDAARRARKEIYENSGETSNTWGAYQIYGDPGFTLPRVRGGNWASEPAPFVAERDVLDAIQWLLRSARMPKVDPEVIEEHVGALLDRARPEWREGEVAFRVGEVLREAGSRAKAVDFYRRAIGTFDGDVNMQAVEKFANQADRLAKDLHDAGKAKEARALVREAGAKLRNLVELSPTPERLALYGGHYKRQIQLSPTSGRVGQWISAGEKWYSESSRLYREHHGRADYYSLLNSVQFAWLAARRSGQLQDDLTDELAADVDSVEAAASLAYDPDVFWSRVSPADVALTRALLDDAVGTDHDKLVAMYSKVLETGTADECDSTINNILFLREALQEHQEAVASQLERLEKDLR